MNDTNPITALDGMPASITIPELRKEFEDIWCDIHNAQRKSYLLMERVAGALDLARAREIDGNNVVLMFQKDSIDVTDWLAGEVWIDAANLLKKAEKLHDRLQEAAR
ncbi:hypothetical protein [Pararhizobium sp. O133]|uniref:hypothetical protein n=1 Tax=Pararhizobium sp. O133 TaxID=3449278 RepID=UPI003F688D41